MLSRVADSVHWMSRYIERAENIARFVDVTENLTLDLPGDEGLEWRALVAATGDDGWFLERYPSFNRSHVVRFLTVDPDYSSSIWSCLRAARENARSVREIISQDMWEHTNRAYLFVREAAAHPAQILNDPEDFLHSVKGACHRIHGSTQVTMTHNDAWYFMQLGRLLERADKTSRILDVKYFLLRPEPSEAGPVEDDLQWSALLQSVSGLEMYRQRHGRISPTRVLDFLLLDQAFPRAIRYCIALAERALHALSAFESGSRHPHSEVERRLGQLRARLEFARVQDILEQGVHDWVDDFQTHLNAVGASMNETFFDLGSSSPPSAPSQSQTQSPTSEAHRDTSAT